MRCTACDNIVDGEAAFCPFCGTSQPNAPSYDHFRYSAFISYRHTPYDAQLAHKLHVALEAYRLPKGVAAPPVDGAKPHHLGRVFRDKEELTASESLPDNIRQALKQSSALIVICSQDTQESAWVAQEVELFASFHGRNRIFLALAAGEPDQSVPPLLLQRTVVKAGVAHTEPTEPLAADFRAAYAKVASPGPRTASSSNQPANPTGSTGSTASSAFEPNSPCAAPNATRTTRQPARAASHRQFAQEKLRLIAGIVGCAYDALRQRDKRRRTRRAILAIAVALAAVLVIGLLSWQAAESHQQAQIEESKHLAAQSQQEFSEGDRYTAIRTALSGLPSDADPDRPVVDETVSALADALEVYPDSSTYWRSSYAIDMPATITGMCSSSSGRWFALLDADLNLRVFDAVTGKLKATCQLPTQPDAKEASPTGAWHIVAGEDSVIAAPDRPNMGSLVCFNAANGKQRWRKGLYCHALTCTENGKVLGMATLLQGGTLTAASLDVETGTVLAKTQVKDRSLQPFPTPTPCVLGDTVDDLYLASGNQIQHIDMNSGTVTRHKLSHPRATAVIYSDGAILAASHDVSGDNPRKMPFAVEAFDANLHRAWAQSGTYAIKNTGMGADSFASSGMPQLYGTTLVAQGKPAAICSAGSRVYGYAPANGTRRFSYKLPSTVVGVGDISAEVPGLWLQLFSADGTLSVVDPAHESSSSLDHTNDLDFPLRLSQAQVVIAGGGYYVALAQSVDNDKQVLAYHSDYTSAIPDYAEQVDNPAARLPNPDKTDYTTEELIARANEVLAEQDS